MAELSPMMRQYMEIKAQHEDSIVFFRLGDFYEMFFEDAKIASEELELVLTGRDCGQEERAPMCGVPYHSCEGYIARLVEKGYKIAICEQVEDPAAAKGIVKREVVKIITPGTVLEDTMLDEGKNNYLCAISIGPEGFGLCFVDASTGELHLTDVNGDNTTKRAIDEIGKYRPREIIVTSDIKNYEELYDFIKNRLSSVITVRDAQSFDIKKTEPLILDHFSVISVGLLGVKEGTLAEYALGAAIEYLKDTGVTGSTSVTSVDFYTEEQFMKLDINTVRNLELTETMRQKAKRGSLLWVLDKTRTAMGKRLIRSWIEKPLMSIAKITLRQNAVGELLENAFLCGEICENLRSIRDIERLTTKLVYGTAGGKDLRAVFATLSALPSIKNLLDSANSKMLKSINADIDPLPAIVKLIGEAIVDEPPFSIREGGIIRKGYNKELDELRDIIEGGTGFIAALEAEEKEKTGIKNLRIRYNKVFGYYIEVTNSFLDRVPENYIRKQTLTNCERYITEELKNIESKVLGAKERIEALEYQIFTEIRKTVAEQILSLQKTAAAISKLDVLCSFASVSAENNYVRPTLNTDGVINIKSGRHPVVEKMLKTPFVSNDTLLDLKENRCAVITGPNMAGKSTFMRQVAVISIMAQIGCFVPATSANICIVDAVFTRVGASDDLASGQSTFMIEMNEVAAIVNGATKNSLIILDEIGRGTSTFDGMAIARAVLEFVANKKTLGAKTLFATHYHELTELENTNEGVKNYNVAVKKRGDDIIFLRRIVRGGTDDSYGIEVAKLAGVPESIISRAKVILKEVNENGLVHYRPVRENINSQLSLDNLTQSEIYEELKAIDAATLTPIEAMKILYDLSEKAKK